VLQVTPVQKNKPRDPPGWGSNVANLKEWEQLSEAENKSSKENQSKILGLKYLNLDGSEAERPPADVESKQSETSSTAGSTGTQRWSKPRPEKSAPKPKPVYSIVGKKNVAVGSDASKTEPEEADSSEWVHACSRTTRRKFLKREAKRQTRTAASEETSESPTEISTGATVKEVQHSQKSFFEAEPELPLVDEDEDEDSEDVTEERNGSTADDGAGSCKFDDEGGTSGSEGDEEDARAFAAEMAAREAKESEELKTEGQESIATSDVSGVASSVPSEDSLTNSSWQSSIACATGDFAMQNVILQMGLRLLSPTGIHVRELSRFGSYFLLLVKYCRKLLEEAQTMLGMLG